MIPTRRVAAAAAMLLICTFVAFNAEAQQRRGGQPDPESPRYKGVLALQAFLADESDAAVQTFFDEKIAASYREEAGDEAVLEMLGKLHDEFAGLESRGARPVGALSAAIMFDTDLGSRQISFEMSDDDTSRFASITTSGGS